MIQINQILMVLMVFDLIHNLSDLEPEAIKIISQKYSTDFTNSFKYH